MSEQENKGGAPSPVTAAPAITRDDIRAVFMAHGFVIKDGQTDLKEYVYRAAEHLLQLADAAKVAAPPAINLHPRDYLLGSCMTEPDGCAVVKLHYATPESASEVFEALADAIDADRAAQAAQEGDSLLLHGHGTDLAIERLQEADKPSLLSRLIGRKGGAA
jgi:hypothetical protein